MTKEQKAKISDLFEKLAKDLSNLLNEEIREKDSQTKNTKENIFFMSDLYRLGGDTNLLVSITRYNE